MSIYGSSKFQVNNYDSWITIKNEIINVSDAKVKDESKKAAGNVIDLLTMRETGTMSSSRTTKKVCLYRMIFI